MVGLGRILLIEDEAGVRFGMRKFLEQSGFEVQEADGPEAAEQEFRARTPDLAILDYALPNVTGLELIPILKKIDERVPIVMLTAHGTIDLAVHAVKHGAEHFLEKPIKLAALLVIVKRILESYRHRRRQIAETFQRHELDPFTGRSDAIKRFADDAHHVLDSHTPVLIQGETGTGKGVLASWLHHHGPRAEEAFVDINCAGLSREFMESELFGHERGAFTGAISAKLGLLDVAHRGTAFLDEIGEIDPALQPRLLKVLEDKRFRRLGAVRDQRVDIRLIAATNRDLTRQAREGRFRSDLLYRINTVALTLPPLRRRADDIPELAADVLSSLGTKIEIAADAMVALQSYGWPGNIRELRNVLERAVLHTSDGVVRACDLRLEASRDSGDDIELTLDEVERRHVERVLAAADGSVELAAQRLGISRSSLYQRLKRYRS